MSIGYIFAIIYFFTTVGTIFYILKNYNFRTESDHDMFCFAMAIAPILGPFFILVTVILNNNIKKGDVLDFL